MLIISLFLANSIISENSLLGYDYLGNGNVEYLNNGNYDMGSSSESSEEYTTYDDGHLAGGF